MKKVFVSVGMTGRYECDVAQDISRAYADIIKRFSGCEIVDNWCCDGPEYDGRLWYLGEAIKKLGDCDACYFVKGWQNYKGCRAEMEICKIYGIEIIEEG